MYTIEHLEKPGTERLFDCIGCVFGEHSFDKDPCPKCKRYYITDMNLNLHDYYTPPLYPDTSYLQ